jgi:signal transduction histidine kinase
MQLHVATDKLPADSPAMPLLNRVLQLMSQVIEEGRNALRGIRSAEANTETLEQAFSVMPQDLAHPGKMTYRVIVEGVPLRLHPVIRDEVCRIGREALVNAYRHSRAKWIEVEIDYAPGQLRVKVQDDGCGIDPHVLLAGREGHWGLPGMRKRADRIGARLKVRSRAGAGTEVDLTVPGHIAYRNHTRRGPSSWLKRLTPSRLKPKSNTGLQDE